jgi:predicted nucleic acid-binding protein
MLPQVKVAQLHEVRLMIESRRLYSLGVGLIDAELIAAIFINSPTLLWTKDKPLRKIADALGIHAICFSRKTGGPAPDFGGFL